MPDRTTIEGTVIDSVTGEPLAGVLVTSRLPPSPTPSPRTPLIPSGRTFVPGAPGEDTLGRPVVQALTDSRGHFAIAAAPGRAGVVFGKDNYGVRTLTYSVTGQTFQAPIVRLAPYGVIAGRVFDSRNAPASSVSVTPYLLHYTQNGLGLGRYPGIKTDDHGEFRLIGLPANSYVLIFSSSGAGAFYPGVAEFSKVEYVNLASGKEIHLKDVVLSTSLKKGSIHVNLTNGPEEGPKDVTYTFVSTVAGIDAGGLDGNSFFSVQRNSSSDPVVHLGVNETRPFSHAASGIGSYRATATWKDANGNAVYSTVNTDFTGEDVDVDFILKPPDGKLTCRVTLDNPDGTSTPVAGVNLILQSSSNPSMNCVTRADGTINVPAIRTGKYTLSGFQGLPADVYVSTATQDGRDVLADGVDVTKESKALEIRARRGAGAARGIVTDSEGRAVHDAVVVAVPESRLTMRVGAGGLYPVDHTDQNGVFEIRGLRPDTYRLYAWSVLGDMALNNAEFFKTLEGVDGKEATVTVKEGQTVSKDLSPLDGPK